MTQNFKIDTKRLGSLIIGVVLSIVLAYVTQPKFHGNDSALQILVTIFSIFAGFIVAVMALIADDKMLRGKSWRQDVFYMKEIESDLTRHKMLFHLYLLVLVLALAVSLKGNWGGTADVWCERILLACAYLAIFASFLLPKQLTERQLKALRKAIKDKKDV